jgi:hypothetical protein
MSEDTIKVHDDDFTPRGTGRPPLVDISKLMYTAARNQGLWVSEVFTNKEAASAMGQLQRRGYEASSTMVDKDHREVFARYM